MLVINRTGPLPGRPGEGFTVTHGGESMRVIIRRVAGNQVYLAIDAPQSFQVTRDDAVKKEPRDARN
jgi:sRNA-binding carbon storage regulator CsrA